MRSSVGGMVGDEGALARLLVAEERLEALVGDARHQAEVMLACADEEAQERLAGLRENLEAAGQEQQDRVTRERSDRLALIERRKSLQLEALQGLDRADVGALAELVVERVLAVAGGSS